MVRDLQILYAGKRCALLEQEDLGFRNIEVWNKVVVGKLVWQLAKDKESKESLWVLCTHESCIPGGDKGVSPLTVT